MPGPAVPAGPGTFLARRKKRAPGQEDAARVCAFVLIRSAAGVRRRPWCRAARRPGPPSTCSMVAEPLALGRYFQMRSKDLGCCPPAVPSPSLRRPLALRPRTLPEMRGRQRRLNEAAPFSLPCLPTIADSGADQYPHLGELHMDSLRGLRPGRFPRPGHPAMQARQKLTQRQSQAIPLSFSPQTVAVILTAAV